MYSRSPFQHVFYVDEMLDFGVLFLDKRITWDNKTV